jgi:hypothetical protein
VFTGKQRQWKNRPPRKKQHRETYQKKQKSKKKNAKIAGDTAPRSGAVKRPRRASGVFAFFFWVFDFFW